MDGTTSTLSIADQQKVIIGREKIIDESLRILNTFFSDATYFPSKECSAAEASCAQARIKLFKQISPTTISTFVKSVVFDASPCQNLSGNERFCAECEDMCENTLYEQRKLLWEKLPLIFDLPPWSELKDPHPGPRVTGYVVSGSDSEWYHAFRWSRFHFLKDPKDFVIYCSTSSERLVSTACLLLAYLLQVSYKILYIVLDSSTWWQNFLLFSVYFASLTRSLVSWFQTFSDIPILIFTFWRA